MKNRAYSELIILSQSGNVEAFQELYYRLRIKVYGFSLKLLRSSVDAEEMTQDIFVRLWESRNRLDPEKNIEAFLFVMTRNCFLDTLKKKKSWNKFIQQQNKTEPSTLSTDQYLDYSECNHLLKTAIENLPEQARKVYSMSRIEGLSHQEISNALSISPHTVNNHIKYSLNSIRKYLNKVSPDITTLLILTFLV